MSELQPVELQRVSALSEQTVVFGSKQESRCSSHTVRAQGPLAVQRLPVN